MTTSDGAAPAEKIRLSGGFWRRFLAVVLDWMMVGLLVTSAAVVAYPATGGVVRMSQPPLRFSYCHPSTVPIGFDPAMPIPGVDPAIQTRLMGDPAAFKPNRVTECVVSLFGFEVDRQTTVAEVHQDGNVTRSMIYTVPVDDSGAVVVPVYLDNAVGPLLLIMLVLQEALFAASLGKAAARLRVVSRNAEGHRAGVGAILGRNLLIYGPFTAVSLYGLAMMSGRLPSGLPAMIVGGVLGLLMLGWLIALLVGLIRGRPDPFWDVWSGTRVVRR